MGAETMGSQGGETQKAKSESLGRQGSLYSLTLEEVENHLGDLGKPLSSMNLDELLKSVWTAEAIAVEHQRQGSVALCRDLRKKTVDEVWRDIQQHQNKNKSDEERKHDEEIRQATLGEMTLEDFLVKAGVVAESPPVLVQHKINVQQQQRPLPVLDAAAYPETQMTPGRKRVAPVDVVEKTVERRQKRMIKNRESAARSRARRQAYTHELENKVSRLEEENERLKKQKEVEKVVPCEPPPEPKYQLRRTTSAPH